MKITQTTVGVMFEFWWLILAVFAWTTLIILWRRAAKKER